MLILRCSVQLLLRLRALLSGISFDGKRVAVKGFAGRSSIGDSELPRRMLARLSKLGAQPLPSHQANVLRDGFSSVYA